MQCSNVVFIGNFTSICQKMLYLNKTYLIFNIYKFELILLGIKSAFAGKGRHPKLVKS